MPENQSSPNTDQITVNRAKFEAITIYEISEEELNRIEQGSPTSNYLNISLVLLSVFFSFLTSLLLTNVSGKTFTIFVVITVVTAVTGIILLFLWWRSKEDSRRIFKKIRSRKNVEQVREIIAEEATQEKNEQEAG